MKKSISYWPLAGILFLFLAACSETTERAKTTSRHLEIKDGAYFINGEKTFINALGYEIGARPGQHPYEDVRALELSRMRNDLKVIKEAGFNAVRTWSELMEEEVDLVQESGLMLVYGIWIEPFGEFGSDEFLLPAEKKVRGIMEWSKKYDCIITYLIMNEPMAGNLNKAGAQNTYNLWTGLRDIIHQEHPGIPVTISNNSAIGEYLNERIFDVYGYNCYQYGEGLPGYTQGFSSHFTYLKEMNGEDKPVLVTEFGMSVSPVNWGGLYGGNTREKQASHIIENFSQMLDSDVDGICPFYYADGWWKGGEPAVHNPWPEEWFGYWGYADEKDTIGYPRPIWYEFRDYNQAIIAAPRNHKIYQGKVPVEFYLSDEVKQARIIHNDKVIYDKAVNLYHFTDEIIFEEENMTDRELIFEFYNKEKELLKWESILILTAKDPVKLPEISLELNTTDLGRESNIKVSFNILNDTKFTLDKNFKYLFSHHVGWEPGEHRLKIIDTGMNEISITDTYKVPEESLVTNVSAGVDIKFGKFTKRIYNQKLIYRGDWADPIRVDKVD